MRRLDLLIVVCVVQFCASACSGDGFDKDTDSKRSSLSESDEDVEGLDFRLPPRAYGAKDAKIINFPYVAAMIETPVNMKEMSRVFCGATLVSSQLAITAAHCVTGKLPTAITLIAGTDSRIPAKGTLIEIVEIDVHPNFAAIPGSSSRTVFDYDVAVLRFKKKIKKSKNVNYIFGTVPGNRSDKQISSLGPVFGFLGWGKMSSNAVPKSLLFGKVENISQAECNSYFFEPTTISTTPRMRCMQAPNTDTCTGDSGGPLISWDKTTKKLIGLVSWGLESCGDLPQGKDKFVSVYTNLEDPEIQKWIDDKLKQYP